MILLRKLHFWSRAAATVYCDNADCHRRGSADLVMQPTGGFAIKYDHAGDWHTVFARADPTAPYRTFCKWHKPDAPKIELAGRNGVEIAREAKRILDGVRK